MVSIYFYKIRGGEENVWGRFLSVCFLGFIFGSRVLSDRDLFPVENTWNTLVCFGIRKIRGHTVRICRDLCAFYRGLRIKKKKIQIRKAV